MNRIIFLGTAGARIVVFKQLRASGGIWFSLMGKEILVDPGPGTLVRCFSRRRKLDPTKLSAIILTHRHLDHSADVNVMIEAMTESGRTPKGRLFLPEDCLGDDPVVLRYVRDFLEEIVYLKPGRVYDAGGVRFSTPIKHIHGDADTYGLLFTLEKLSIGYVSDTKYFDGLIEAYPADVLILNVVRYRPIQYDHLDLEGAKRLILGIKPKLAVLTHFGMTMLRAKPWKLAPLLSKELGIEVLCARDGLMIDLEEKLTRLQ